MLKQAIILFSTQAEALRFRKSSALACNNSLLGLSITTPSALIEDLWDVWGSDETLVNSIQRKMIISQLLLKQENWVSSLGSVSLLSQFVENYAIYLNKAFYQEYSEQFRTVDKQIYAFVQDYLRKLDSLGLIEPASALVKLSTSVALPCVVWRVPDTLPIFFKPLLSKMAQNFVCCSPQISEDDEVVTWISQDMNFSLEQRGQVSFSETSNVSSKKTYKHLRAAGTTASSYLVAETVFDAGQKATCLVTAPDPLVEFSHLEKALIREGYLVSLRANKTFCATFFGQAYCAATTIAQLKQPASREELLQSVETFARSPYAQITHEQKSNLLQQIHQDRTLGAADFRAFFTQASPSFEYFEELFETSDASILLGYFEELTYRSGFTEEEQQAERAIIAATKKIYSQARGLGLEPQLFFDFLSSLSVPYSVDKGPQVNVATETDGCSTLKPLLNNQGFSAPELPQECKGWVCFTTLQKAASLPANSYHTAILTSLDNTHYNGAQKHSSLTEFCQRYDLAEQPLSAEILEKQFLQVCATAKNTVAFEYAEKDLNGQPCFPAFFLESFLSSYRKSEGELETRRLGEDNFGQLVHVLPFSETNVHSVPSIVRGSFDNKKHSLLRYVEDGAGIKRPVLSPSAIEAYRNCPYRWFVERMLSLDAGEEQFGPLEKGSFVHKIFQEFYSQLALAGHKRVAPQNIQDAQALFSAVFHRCVEEQETLSPGQRLVAVTELERKQIERLKVQLEKSLSFQQYLLPGYEVHAHETALTPEDGAVYAGAIINGRVDRIDVDGQGNFVVLDYKGSTAFHAAGFDPEDSEEFEVPHKVQALIYAQALLRLKGGLHPKGALYLSYSAKTPKELLRGSASEILPEIDAFTTKGSMVFGSFETYLNKVEESLVPTVENMKAGIIEPKPAGKTSCRFCPVLYCEKRINGS